MFILQLIPLQSYADIIIAKNGKALAEIVTGKKPTKIVSFAAKELKTYLDRVSGASFNIVEEKKASPSIILGDCAYSRAKGLDVKKLKRDGFYRTTKGKDIYILGRDNPVKGNFKTQPKRTFVWYVERATLFGVYDFLEKECGIRWFMPGKMGEVVPKMNIISISSHDIKDEPKNIDRGFSQAHVFHYYKKNGAYPDIKDLCKDENEIWLWLLRIRYQTEDLVSGCHSSHYMEFDKRFGTDHPEYFALMPNDTRSIKTGRGYYLCYSEKGLSDTFIKDARAYLTGKSAQSRGIKSWKHIAYKNQYMIDPNDAYPGCNCKKCLSILKKYKSIDYSEVMFQAITKVAQGVKDIKDTYITTLVYGSKMFPPKSVKLPENVMIRLCIAGPNAVYRPLANNAQIDLLKEWRARIKGNIVLYTYTIASYKKHLLGVPEIFPHAMSKFLKQVEPYTEGMYMCSGAVVEIYRLLNHYMMMKLLWDPNQDIDKLLDDYFAKLYGPSSKEIKQIYRILEDNWEKIMTFYPENKNMNNLWRANAYGVASTSDVWEKIYTEAEMNRIKKLLDVASKKAKHNTLVKKRIAFFEKWAYGTLLKYRKIYISTFGSMQQKKVSCYYIPKDSLNKPNDSLNKSELEKIEWQNLVSVSKKHKSNVEGKFKTWWNKTDFYLLAELEEPLLTLSATSLARKNDDSEIWKDNSIELMLNVPDEDNSTFHILINDRGVYSDLVHKLERPIWQWSSSLDVKVCRNKKMWSVLLRIPFSTMAMKYPSEYESLKFNVVRHRSIKNKKSEFYGWSPQAKPGSWTDPLYFGKIIFTKKVPVKKRENELIINGSFEKGLKNWSLWGKKYGAKAEIIDNDVKNGRKALKVIKLKIPHGGPVQTINVPIKNNAEYKLSLWIKLNTSSQVSFYLKYLLPNGKKERIKLASSMVLAGTWTHVENNSRIRLQNSVSETSKGTVLYMVLTKNSSGKYPNIVIDDISLKIKE